MARELAPLAEKARDPGERHRLFLALGYAYTKAGDYDQAVQAFQEAVQAKPGIPGREAHRAVDWFKRALDNQPFYLADTPAEQENLRRELYGLRKEVTKLNTRLDVTTYLSFQSTGRGQSVAPVSPGAPGGGAVPSQAGVEVAYTPPKVGFRDERILQVFGRVLWNVEPRSLKFEEDSYQGGFGLRYKPLKTQNLWLWGERLVAFGDQALDSWLLRLLYSWDYGYDLRLGEKWYAYGDVAYFTKEPGRWAYYFEGRQGITFNIRDRFLITPHLDWLRSPQAVIER